MLFQVAGFRAADEWPPGCERRWPACRVGRRHSQSGRWQGMGRAKGARGARIPSTQVRPAPTGRRSPYGSWAWRSPSSPTHMRSGVPRIPRLCSSEQRMIGPDKRQPVPESGDGFRRLLTARIGNTSATWGPPPAGRLHRACGAEFPKRASYAGRAVQRQTGRGRQARTDCRRNATGRAVSKWLTHIEQPCAEQSAAYA